MRRAALGQESLLRLPVRGDGKATTPKEPDLEDDFARATSGERGEGKAGTLRRSAAKKALQCRSIPPAEVAKVRSRSGPEIIAMPGWTA
jgi:hypothetical protein